MASRANAPDPGVRRRVTTSIEDKLRLIVTALPEQASVTLPILVVMKWLEVEADDPLADLTVADFAEQPGRSRGTVRDRIRRGELEAHQLGKEYRITRLARTMSCRRQRNGPGTLDRSENAPTLWHRGRLQDVPKQRPPRSGNPGAMAVAALRGPDIFIADPNT